VPENELATAWPEICDEMRAVVGEFTHHLWVAPLRPVEFEDGVLVVEAPRAIRGWVEEQQVPLLRDTAARVLGRAVVVRVVDEGGSATAGATRAPARGAAPPGPAEETPPRDLLNPKYTFDQFVIGGGNRLAHAAALTVAEQPAQAYNPLFIHGPPGLGKTHLLHAIGNYVRRHDPGLVVRYATVEAFTNDFVSAVRGGATAGFKERFRAADLVLIDDVQFLAGKVKTSEEFFHSFNALYEGGSQVVMTSDQRPGDLRDFEARLQERFACGLVAELDPPEFAVRTAILRKRAALDELLADVDDETLVAIASHVEGSVRALEGALVRVVAYTSLTGRAPTPDLVREVLERLYPRPRTPALSAARIGAETASAFGLTGDELLARTRKPTHSLARQVAMYLARELTDESLPAIGRSFGRNHATVIHAHRKIAETLAHDSGLRRTVGDVRERLTAAQGDRN